MFCRKFLISTHLQSCLFAVAFNYSHLSSLITEPPLRRTRGKCRVDSKVQKTLENPNGCRKSRFYRKSNSHTFVWLVFFVTDTHTHRTTLSHSVPKRQPVDSKFSECKLFAANPNVGKSQFCQKSYCSYTCLLLIHAEPLSRSSVPR